MSTIDDTVDYTKLEGSELQEACGADGVKWAKAFNQHAVQQGYPAMDEGWLIGWFANAIEFGHMTKMNPKPEVAPPSFGTIKFP